MGYKSTRCLTRERALALINRKFDNIEECHNEELEEILCAFKEHTLDNFTIMDEPDENTETETYIY